MHVNFNSKTFLQLKHVSRMTMSRWTICTNRKKCLVCEERVVVRLWRTHYANRRERHIQFLLLLLLLLLLLFLFFCRAHLTWNVNDTYNNKNNIRLEHTCPISSLIRFIIRRTAMIFIDTHVVCRIYNFVRIINNVCRIFTENLQSILISTDEFQWYRTSTYRSIVRISCWTILWIQMNVTTAFILLSIPIHVCVCVCVCVMHWLLTSCLLISFVANKR
jgi:hypothetical protein